MTSAGLSPVATVTQPRGVEGGTSSFQGWDSPLPAPTGGFYSDFPCQEPPCVANLWKSRYWNYCTRTWGCCQLSVTSSVCSSLGGEAEGVWGSGRVWEWTPWICRRPWMDSPHPGQLQLRFPGRRSFPGARSGNGGWIQVWGQWGWSPLWGWWSPIPRGIGWAAPCSSSQPQANVLVPKSPNKARIPS